jgi:hypothetical protein
VIELRSEGVIDRAAKTICPWLGVSALAAAIALASAPLARAQTGAEYPRTINGGGVPGADIHPSLPSGGGSSSSVVVPEGPAGDDEGPPPATAPSHTSTHHHTSAHRSGAAPTNDYASIEPAEGHLKLTADSWAYERPSKSSTRVEQVHAGKFVNVIGTSPSYVQIKLKNSEVAYVPQTAVQLVTPSDKMFQLTNDSPVLSAPNHSAKKLSEVHKGHSVHVVGVALNYMRIRMKDGTEGYIPVGALE